MKKTAKDRLASIRCYVEVSTCKRDFLLQAFEQRVTSCETCISCEQLRDIPGPLSEPWLEEQEFSQEVLESVYKPFDTLLEFLESHKAASLQENYSGLGETKIVMALQGVSQKLLGSEGTAVKLGRREQDNPFFGHLAFIKEKEIERSLGQAERDGFVSKAPYLSSHTYCISGAGSEYLSRQRHRKFRRGET